MKAQRDRSQGRRLLTIMLVDDDMQFAAEMRSILSGRYGVLLESGSCQALTRLRELPIDMAIVDADLPPFLGPYSYDEGLILTRLLSDYHTIPTVVISNSNDEALYREAMRAGAVAIEMKENLGPERLCRLVERHCGTHTEVVQRGGS